MSNEMTAYPTPPATRCLYSTIGECEAQGYVKIELEVGINRMTAYVCMNHARNKREGWQRGTREAQRAAKIFIAALEEFCFERTTGLLQRTRGESTAAPRRRRIAAADDDTI